MVENLPDVIVPPTPGPQESVLEIPTSTTYYDGSLNLNVAKIGCGVYIQNDCYKQVNCGMKKLKNQQQQKKEFYYNK